MGDESQHRGMDANTHSSKDSFWITEFTGVVHKDKVRTT